MTAIHYQPCDDCPPVMSRQSTSRRSASRQSALRQPASRQPALRQPALRQPGAGHVATDLLREAARRVLHTVRVWRRRVRERNELARLNEYTLADIGLTPGDRDFLVNKPFWRE